MNDITETTALVFYFQFSMFSIFYLNIYGWFVFLTSVLIVFPLILVYST